MTRLDKIIDNYITKLQEDVGWKNLPEGWDEESVKKFAKSLKDEGLDSNNKKEWFEGCTNKIKGVINDPEAFCASVLDTIERNPYWRGKSSKKGE
jgi:hypothetical protein